MELDAEDHENTQETSDFSFEKSFHGKKKVRKGTKKKKSHKKTKDLNEPNTSNNLGNSQSESQSESQKEIKDLKEQMDEKVENVIKEDKKEEDLIEIKDDNKEIKENENKEGKKVEEEKKEEVKVDEQKIVEEKKEEKIEENKEKAEEVKDNNEKQKEEENKENKNTEENKDKNGNDKEKEEEKPKEEQNLKTNDESKKEEKEQKPEEDKNKKPSQPEGPKKISEFDLINQDPYLKNFEWAIKRRNEHFKNLLHQIESNEKSLENFSNSYQNMGLHVLPNGDIKYREYAPGARGIALFGEFNNWNRDQYWAKRDQYGFWELIIPNEDGKPRIKHKTKVKCNVVLNNGQWADRNPIWIEYLYQNTQSLIFDGVFWNPEEKYVWKYPKKHMPRPRSLRIYEAHVGMSSFYPKITTYKDFAENILPRIKKLGYTAVQLMAIMHHANYASFGYHVNNSLLYLHYLEHLKN